MKNTRGKSKKLRISRSFLLCPLVAGIFLTLQDPQAGIHIPPFPQLGHTMVNGIRRKGIGGSGTVDTTQLLVHQQVLVQVGIPQSLAQGIGPQPGELTAALGGTAGGLS